MITIQAKKHDNFSVEFKFGFVGTPNAEQDDFAVNWWVFVPNSIDINPQTYGKDQFYRDIKSNVRLITPTYLLRDLTVADSLPTECLRSALLALAANPQPSEVDEYEYQIKMFAAIYKSALRDQAVYIRDKATENEMDYLVENFVGDTRTILSLYRDLYPLINVPTVTDSLRNYFLFGDEFMSHIVDVQAMRIIKRIDSELNRYAAQRKLLTELIGEERSYKQRMHYQTLSSDDAVNNRQLVFRYGMLKKYIESDLYIRLDKRRDGVAVQQIYYSIAAGIAMIFATVVSFSFQRRFGSMSIPLFVALVISYMLKDRIKELTRYYFAHRLGDKYYDNKAEIKINNKVVGQIKEGVDFISDHRTPKQVMDIRSRSSLVEAENRVFEEKIILYRKHVSIDNRALEQNNHYPVSGINEILRLHTTRFTQKMDNPEVPLDTLDSQNRVVSVAVQKIYYINIVMQLQWAGNVEYRRFRIVMTHDGIIGVEQIC